MDICGNYLDTDIRDGVTTYMRGSQIYTGEVKHGIFVYGSQVNDFHTINKDTIWTITLSATQEIDAQLQLANSNIAKQAIRMAEQDIRMAELERIVRKQQADIERLLLR
jgi:hypothetical protein